MDEDEDADEDGTSLLLDDAVDNRGHVRLAFCPLTTTKLAPDLPLFTGWSDCNGNEAVRVILLRSSAEEERKQVALVSGASQ